VSGGGRIVTFYSYKGGTGRSMALANVAWVLASQGARVLVVDWDLEAPGLHRYFRPFLADKDLQGFESQGLIDLVCDVSARHAAAGTGTAPPDARWLEQQADVSRWAKPLLWPSGEDAVTARHGSIDFLPAGRQDARYAQRVNSFDWAAFYERRNGGAFMDALRRSMARYDWVLIDSRTGVSDTAGICTVQLPDVLVVCFTLNHQSISGASAVAASARAARREGELRILPLPTRLDGNEEDSLKAMMREARRRFGPLLDPRLDADRYWLEMGVPYFSRYAYGEKLAPFEDQVNLSTSTLPSMERLTSYVTGGAVTALAPLPEEHRQAARDEFQGVETELDGPAPGAAASASGGLLQRTQVGLSRAWYRSAPLRNAALMGAVALPAVLIGRQSACTAGPAGTSPEKIVARLLSDADAARLAGQREQSALLVAEAASRLDPATVVGAASDSGRGLYQALTALQPFRLSPSGDAAGATLLAAQDGRKGTTAIAFSADGRYVASAGPARAARLFRFPPSRRTLDVREVGYAAVAFSPDSRLLATGGRNGSVNVIDVATGTRVWQWANEDPDSAWSNALAFSPNGNLLAAGTDTGHVVIAKVDPWTVLAERREAGGVASLVFSPDSRYLATAGARGGAQFWSYQQDKPVEAFGRAAGAADALAFVPGAETRRVAVLAGGGVRVYTQTEGLPIHADVTGAGTTAIAVSPDGRTLATAETDAVRLWSLPQLTAAGSFAFPAATSMTFSSDGTLLACGDAKGAVRAWRLGANGPAPAAALSFPGRLNVLTLSPNAQYLAAASEQGTYVALLSDASGALSAAEARDLACSQAGAARLSQQDWTRLVGAEPLRYACAPAD
jgi:WD40 repeat protein